MKIHPLNSWGFMVFSWTILGCSTSALICSFSEAQKGAEDKGQIKAPLGGMPVRAGALGSGLVLIALLGGMPVRAGALGSGLVLIALLGKLPATGAGTKRNNHSDWFPRYDFLLVPEVKKNAPDRVCPGE